MARTGRPRSFDRDAAVTSAMRLFWERGYEAASLDQLRHGMGGISSASFYAAFGSKEKLYREALNRYLQTYGLATAPLRDESLPPRARIEQALLRSARMQTDASHPAGCMITLSAAMYSDASDALGALTASERQANRAGILRCVQLAIETGELDEKTDAVGLASLFDGLINGFSAQARDGVSASAMEAAIRSSLALWDSHRSGGVNSRTGESGFHAGFSKADRLLPASRSSDSESAEARSNSVHSAHGPAPRER